ncbi:hypothetical protein WICMUC_000446 [Wickerhamomyces mucosus]|uniref:Luciferase-like domain-containing protein n=1 Tax=Wickerhamomyces mucosus TaxID=1378264 RepID=A0A9P8PZV2_9ASCO|nr:hypothetical protein WICMUC_000446 [Wickerhamomyces mucosus]
MTAQEQSNKRQKRVKGPLILSAATRNSATNWRNPDDRSAEFTTNIKAAVEFAQIAERGKLTNVFYVDHLSFYTYDGDYKFSAKNGINASRVDPLALISAVALSTENIGIISTASTISEHPYHFFRRLASVEHLSNNRVGWNIVSSYLETIGPNLLNGAPLPEHDERYVKTSEYLDVVYKLFLSSWREDALKYDRPNGILADPELIRTIDHKGKYFQVEGPANVEPARSGIPLIVQAGTSTKGIEFAAENAELVFIATEQLSKITTIRKLAQDKFGRDPNSIKFISSLKVFVAKTHEEAEIKRTKFSEYEDPEAGLAYFGGVSGFDLAKYDWDEPITLTKPSNGIRSSVKDAFHTGAKIQTKRDLAARWRNNGAIIGTPVEIADYIEKFVEDNDVDGFNLSVNNFPQSLNDIVDLLIPELQKRGLAQKEYPVPGGSLRENFYGVKGQYFVPENHPAYKLRWKEGVSREKFEKELKEYELLRDARRATN